MRAWLSRSDLTSAISSSVSFLYLRSCAGESGDDWLRSRLAMSWSCRRRRGQPQRHHGLMNVRAILSTERSVR
jgi:hypothetical protein